MRDRPLSPHLSVYRFQYTMLLSITHRISGVGLSVGLVVFVAWLIAAARGPEAYARAMTVLSSLPFRALYALWLLAFAYHLANGVRHLAWDLGLGLEKREAQRSAGVAVIGALALFAVLAWFALVVRGEAP